MEGWWDCDRLDIFFTKILDADLESTVKGFWTYLKDALTAKFKNLQSPARAFQIGTTHYDKGNELCSRMLDPSMTYTCGYWKELEETPENLERAQKQKLDLVCRKLGLEEGMKVLDIGCGWGSFMKYVAENYGVNVVGYTVSREQVEFGRQNTNGYQLNSAWRTTGMPDKRKRNTTGSHHWACLSMWAIKTIQHSCKLPVVA